MGNTQIGKSAIAFGIVLLIGSSAWAVPVAFETGTYHLGNHPDGNARPPAYGARIDNLYGGGVFTFDFECVGCNMEMRYDGTTIRIDGTAFGGHDDGVSATRVDDAVDGLYEFHVSYSVADVVENGGSGDGDGLQDIGLPGATGSPIGTLEYLSNNMVWELQDKQGSHPASLRIGNEDDDAGHRGFVGISGWGWLLFREAGTTAWADAQGSQDWLFIANKRSNNAPEPGAVSLMLIGLAAFAARRKKS